MPIPVFFTKALPLQLTILHVQLENVSSHNILNCFHFDLVKPLLIALTSTGFVHTQFENSVK